MQKFFSALVVASAAVATVLGSAVPSPKRETASLNELFVAQGKQFFGAAVNATDFNDPAKVALLKSQYGSLTPKHVFTWDLIEHNRYAFNVFGDADRFAKFVKDNDLQARGHATIWHSQLASWVYQLTDPEDLTEAIRNHINNVNTRYKGTFQSWDAINEIFNSDGSFRPSHFYNVLGEDFVYIALKAIRDVDPTVKLYINEYGLESNPRKLKALISFVKDFNAKHTDVKFDGIGTQTHLQPGQGKLVADTLKQLALAGVEVAITELDVSNAPSEDYVEVVRACKAIKACVSITTWGPSDDPAERSDNALLFDAESQPKQAYFDVVAALSE